MFHPTSVSWMGSRMKTLDPAVLTNRLKSQPGEGQIDSEHLFVSWSQGLTMTQKLIVILLNVGARTHKWDAPRCVSVHQLFPLARHRHGVR